MLNFRDKILVSFLILIAVLTFLFWIVILYFGLTRSIAKNGGEYTEGIVGQPIYINPLLSQTSNADGDLVALIYSGLFRYDKQGKIQNDLAENYQISEDKKTYTIFLKKNVKWQDGNFLTVDDVLFTFNILKDPAYKSPLRQNWQGVEISRIDDYSFKFELKNPYFGFLDNLTVGILPKHIWQDISAERFALAEKNLKPIGSGPYLFDDFQKDSSGNIITYKLAVFKEYYGSIAHISKINFNFYPNEDALIEAFRKRNCRNEQYFTKKIEEIATLKNIEIKELVIPRYFALFINQLKSVPLAYDEVRKALSIGTDRQEIINQVLNGRGFPLYSPIFPQMKGFRDIDGEYGFDLEKAKKILEEAGWKYDETENVRKKDNQKLEIEIITTDWAELIGNAEILRTQWARLGVKVEVRILPVSDFQQNYIRTREYQTVLFGQALSFNPDLYSFWHSSNKRDPGLNLSLFENKKADELLEAIRQENDEAKRNEKYGEFLQILQEKNPAIFLYSQYYLYPISRSIKGNETQNINLASNRFSNINDWYVKTKRIWKGLD